MTKMNLTTLCEGIHLQYEMIEKVEAFLACCETEALEPLIEEICCMQTNETGNHKLLTLFADAAPDNIPVLACHLLCAVRIYEEYQKKGIPDTIYYDTMSVFTRVCAENYGHCGLWQYDRGYWNYRHVSMQIFRIGALEYELKEWEGVPSLVIHIPSDAEFTESQLDHTFHAVRSFLMQYYPERSRDRILCSSWLMAPRLRELLPGTAGILRFQNHFQPVAENPDSDACVRWLFYPHDKEDISSYAENTSLQRKVKAIMLAGGHLGAGWGILKE